MQRDHIPDISEARGLYPATGESAYLNTAAVGLASRAVGEVYRDFVDGWVRAGLDFSQGEAAGERCRAMVADLIGADVSEVALIASASASAGLVASQFGPARAGQNVVIGQREFSSNQFPWQMLAKRGYEVREVPFRNGGIEPGDVAAHVDRRTKVIAFSGVQAATGHRSDVPAIGEIARAAGALVYVDGSQLIGANQVSGDLEWIDILATGDHKFLLHAGRGMGYCYLSPRAREMFTPVSPGWKAGAVPSLSYFGPQMELSDTASRFDNSISWVAAVGNEAALSVFDDFGSADIYRRNAELAELLRHALAECGWAPVDLPARNRSTIVAVPLGDRDAAHTISELRRRGVICAARDANLRISVHLYNHEDDILQLTEALGEI